MTCKLKILFFLILGIGAYQSQSQVLEKQEQLHLFTDQDFCISGDTLWFKVKMPEFTLQKENVVRVQIDGKGNNIITTVIKKAENGWAQGFINVPDSLSSGQYFVLVWLLLSSFLPN